MRDADTQGMHAHKPLYLFAILITCLLMPAAAFAHAGTGSTSAKRHHAVRFLHGSLARPSHRYRATLARQPRSPQAPQVVRRSPQAPQVVIPATTGTSYYVSPTGSDANSGTSPSAAWLTVKRVDQASLTPGDQVFFQGGATFSDDTLMPGGGVGTSGTTTAPIAFGSYGEGEARITQGVWFKSDNNLVFQNLILGPTSGFTGYGFQGTGDGIVIVHDTIEHVNLGVNSMGNNWTIANNTINDTGNSGMLLGFNASTPGDPAGGTNYLVSGNTITYTGLDPSYDYGTHGIYLKVANATVVNNTIAHFHDDAISVRYRNSTISGNNVSYGAIGIAWFQFDALPGASNWTNNTISNVSSAGIFVCGIREGCLQPLESFHISDNTITSPSGVAMNLQPTAGSYTVMRNTVS